jgi:hypothetical protein
VAGRTSRETANPDRGLAADEKALAESQIGFASALALAERLQKTRALLQEELQAFSAQEGLSMWLEEVAPYPAGFGARMATC